ncbi:hypothetical protein [Yeosuana marina]|uniref:hypothetical protein n=1 Tax=Yeosuana marina TaxID=1565536 RepID=UPI00141D7C1D|nr:hypothetical protein [Yeosuana marina]
MDVKQFMNQVFEKFNSQITDEIFLCIENDKSLLHDYLKLIETNKLNVLNSNIAKSIKAKYGLENKDLKNKTPKSKLIQSYEQFEL